MDDSLESLLEKATNPKNKYEDWEFIMAFCDRVNTEQEGPPLALKMIVPKMRHENEKVNMLALTLLEACVKNCGQRFHQELGKFRFLNEFIKMLSEKYLGKHTPVAVKDRIKALLYSWKAGLPSEGKIAEAYEMLKKEGLVFDESRPPDATLHPEKQKPKVSLSQDPKQARILQRLLASKNPDDLRAANRLIREMVRRDDKRMERMKRRLDELELVQNNIKLMNELLSHYKSNSGTQERLLLEELYKSLEKMRPNMFRMASNLKPEDEGMDDILQTNDDLLRVMDTYKRVMVGGEGGGSSEGAAGRNPVQNGAMTGTGVQSDGGVAQVPEEAGAVGGGTALGGGANSGGGGGGDASTLIDLADLDFGAIPTTGAVTPSTADSLLDALGTLDFSSTGTPVTSQNTSLLDFPPILTNLTPASQPQAVVPNAGPSLPSTTSSSPQPPVAARPFSLPPPPASQYPISTMFSGGASPATGQTRPQAAVTHSTVAPNQPHATSIPSSATPTTNAAVDLLSDLNLNLMQPPKLIGGTLGGQQISAPVATTVPRAWGAFQSDPLAVLGDLFIPKDKIQPSTLPPLQVLNKNGVSVSLHFTKNAPAPSVAVVVISAISTNALPLSKFQIQVAVPKVMRVKLQPPTGTELVAFNPMLPPANISQIMLLANPTKDTIRLKYRISWVQDGQETVETGEVANFPAL